MKFVFTPNPLSGKDFLELDTNDKFVISSLEEARYFATNSPLLILETYLGTMSNIYYGNDSQQNIQLIPDYMYDEMRDILANRNPRSKYLEKTGAIEISKESVKLPWPMSSLDKIKEIDGDGPITKYLSRFVNCPSFIVSDKLDGVSAQLVFDGDGNVKMYSQTSETFGKDISHLISSVFYKEYPLPQLKNTTIRGELILSKAKFKEIQEHFPGEYKNARNTVAGVVNTKHPKPFIASRTRFIAYAIMSPVYDVEEQFKMLHNHKFLYSPYTKFDRNDINSKELAEFATTRRETSLYDIDGIVIATGVGAYPPTESNPKHMFAFKKQFQEQIAEATVKYVEWNVSKNKLIKPKLVLEPVDLVGVTISNVTAFNAGYIVQHKIGPGTIIKLIRSGDVIPHILEVVKSTQAQLPEIKYEWTDTNVDIVAVEETKETKNQILAKQLYSFFSTMNIKYAGEGICEKLVNAGYPTIVEILNESPKTLAKIDGVGEKMIEKITTNTLEAFRECSLETLMDASNVFGRGLGTKKLRLLLNYNPDLWKSKNVDVQDIVANVSGFDTISAAQFSEHLAEFQQFFERLKTVKTLPLDRFETVSIKKPTGNLFENQKIVFTGVRNKKWEDFIIANKGSISTSVSKNTTIVVYVPSDKGSSKFDKAKELGISVFTPEEFQQKYGLDL